jgi:hypothetical protein
MEDWAAGLNSNLGHDLRIYQGEIESLAERAKLLAEGAKLSWFSSQTHFSRYPPKFRG